MYREREREIDISAGSAVEDGPPGDDGPAAAPGDDGRKQTHTESSPCG